MTAKRLDLKLELYVARFFEVAVAAGYDSSSVAAAMVRGAALLARIKGIDRMTFLAVCETAFKAVDEEPSKPD